MAHTHTNVSVLHILKYRVYLNMTTAVSLTFDMLSNQMWMSLLNHNTILPHSPRPFTIRLQPLRSHISTLYDRLTSMPHRGSGGHHRYHNLFQLPTRIRCKTYILSVTFMSCVPNNSYLIAFMSCVPNSSLSAFIMKCESIHLISYHHQKIFITKLYRPIWVS